MLCFSKRDGILCNYTRCHNFHINEFKIVYQFTFIQVVFILFKYYFIHIEITYEMTYITFAAKIVYIYDFCYKRFLSELQTTVMGKPITMLLRFNEACCY